MRVFCPLVPWIGSTRCTCILEYGFEAEKQSNIAYEKAQGNLFGVKEVESKDV